MSKLLKCPTSLVWVYTSQQNCAQSRDCMMATFRIFDYQTILIARLFTQNVSSTVVVVLVVYFHKK